MVHFIQELNYSENPDFSKYIPSDAYFSLDDNIKIQEIINYFDAQIEYLTSKNIQHAPKKFLELIEGKVQELLELIKRRTENDNELLETLTLIINTAIVHIQNYLGYTISNKNFTLVRSTPELMDKLATFKSEGFLEFQIPHSEEFILICNTLMEGFKKQYAQQEDWRGANSLDRNSEEYKFLFNFIKDNQIVELISAYKKMEMEVFYIAVDYSHHRQKWFRNNHIFGKLVPTNYYHYDADANIAKMLIYLSDVQEGDGPFKIVKGSNRLSRSIFLNYIHYSIDSKISPLFFNKENLYGRGLFLYRKDLLMKFPQVFIGSTHFGDDLIEESLLSKYMVEKTITFTRKKGAAILFDGFRGIHAGGNAEKGERLAVQIAFKKVEVSLNQNSTASLVKRFAKNLFRK